MLPNKLFPKYKFIFIFLCVLSYCLGLSMIFNQNANNIINNYKSGNFESRLRRISNIKNIMNSNSPQKNDILEYLTYSPYFGNGFTCIFFPGIIITYEYSGVANNNGWGRDTLYIWIGYKFIQIHTIGRWIS